MTQRFTADESAAGAHAPAAGEPVVSYGYAAEGDSTEPRLPGDNACDTDATGATGAADVTDAAYATGTANAADAVDRSTPDAALAAERLEDLRRLQAEYVNYKKRVDRDRSLAREAGITYVLESMLPVLDEIHLAREHGDLDGGPFAAIAEKLEATLAKLGIERFGSVGDEFDPNFHEALMNIAADLPEGATATTVVQVLQPGFRLGERVVRAARVAVADPQ